VKLRIGFWNRLYLAIALVALIVAPIAWMFHIGAEESEASRSWIRYCETSNLSVTPSDYEGYQRCIDLRRYARPHILDEMREAALVVVVLSVVIWVVLAGLIALARWVARGRRIN